MGGGVLPSSPAQERSLGFGCPFNAYSLLVALTKVSTECKAEPQH